ncbi:hypothetical protein pEaSNUABM29_00019 [Erwinia phage pEa_SNUABM_29]|nr:hypothetical protein pEaSNUABM29_00019 [Erwinia phage pEa_SNUABM_29]
MFGVFRERNRLRHRVECLELELTIQKVGLGATKETYQKALKDAFIENAKLKDEKAQLERDVKALQDELETGHRELRSRDRMVGMFFGQLILFTEKRWDTRVALEFIYKHLSLHGKRSAAKEYFEGHGYEVKDED